MLTAIWMARQINEALGGPFVAPWEIGELPEEWTDAILGMKTRVAAMAQGKQQVESALEKWRQSAGYKQ